MHNLPPHSVLQRCTFSEPVTCDPGSTCHFPPPSKKTHPGPPASALRACALPHIIPLAAWLCRGWVQGTLGAPPQKGACSRAGRSWSWGLCAWASAQVARAPEGTAAPCLTRGFCGGAAQGGLAQAVCHSHPHKHWDAAKETALAETGELPMMSIWIWGGKPLPSWQPHLS